MCIKQKNDNELHKKKIYADYYRITHHRSNYSFTSVL